MKEDFELSNCKECYQVTKYGCLKCYSKKIEKYTHEEIDNLRQKLELKFMKEFGINAGGKCVRMIRDTFKEELK